MSTARPMSYSLFFRCGMYEDHEPLLGGCKGWTNEPFPLQCICPCHGNNPPAVNVDRILGSLDASKNAAYCRAPVKGASA